MQKISQNHKHTGKIAQEFLKKLKPNPQKATIVGLYGDLGTGKTTFTQAIARELGIKRKVNSPTYVIIKNYELRITNFKKLIHIDAYRLKNEKELLHLGWDEIVSNKEHLVFIEWPENIIKALPQKHHQIRISHTSANHRKFQIKTI